MSHSTTLDPLSLLNKVLREKETSKEINVSKTYTSDIFSL